MDSASVLAAFRTLALATKEITDLVGTQVHVSRADVQGRVPAVVLTLDGGDGRISPRHHLLDIRADLYSATSWAEALAIQKALATVADPQDAVAAAATYPSPILRIRASGAPKQLAGGDYYRVQQTFTVLAKEI